MKISKHKLKKIIIEEVEKASLKGKSFHADLINELLQVYDEYGIKCAFIGKAYNEDDKPGTLILLDEYRDSCNNAPGSFKKALEFLKDIYGDSRVKKIAKTKWKYAKNKKSSQTAKSLESVFFPRSLGDEIFVMPASWIPVDLIEEVLKDPESGLEDYLIHIEMRSTGFA